MAAEKVDTPLTGLNAESETLMTPTKTSAEQVLDDLASYLTESCRIVNDVDSYKNRRRYAELKHVSIFNSLVYLYTHMFNSNWNHFKRVHEAYKLQSAAIIAPSAVPRTDGASGSSSSAATPTHDEPLPEAPMYMARVYVSHWFLDLYRSMRASCPDLSGLAFQQKFRTPIEEQSTVYDVFMSILIEHIRPTPLNGILEDTMFIPCIEVTTGNIFDDPKNPFAIQDFILNEDYFRNTIAAIKDNRSGWKTTAKTTTLIGRPSWLFDWPKPNIMCAWFPMDRNFTVEDCVVAYIIGVACTPKLSPRDVDDIQQWPNNMKPTSTDDFNFKRVRPLSKNGGYEYREVNEDVIKRFTLRNPLNFLTDQMRVLRKRPREEEQRAEPGPAQQEQTPEPTAKWSQPEIKMAADFNATIVGYQITDYLYYYRIVKKVSKAQRRLCLHEIIHDM